MTVDERVQRMKVGLLLILIILFLAVLLWQWRDKALADVRVEPRATLEFGQAQPADVIMSTQRYEYDAGAGIKSLLNVECFGDPAMCRVPMPREVKRLRIRAVSIDGLKSPWSEWVER